jgi:D-alanyl-D-alanine carboxypeptidase/D-alanyl-D-alanine-endopeptidase (penicillin-binding protein 4)
MNYRSSARAAGLPRSRVARFGEPRRRSLSRFASGGGTACATFVVALTIAACATTKPLAPASQVRLKPDTTDTLKRDIDAILAQPALDHGYWGVLVRSLKTDETLYTLNARKLMMPASNMKIVTLAATAARLGWDYTYETTVLAAGPIESGILHGDLVVVGSGDPSLVAADGMAERVFAEWSEQLNSKGVRTIDGRIIGDDNAFDDDGLGFGWSWDDLADGYAAGISALQFNEGQVRVTIGPGAAVGHPASIAVTPDGSGLIIRNSLKTTATNSPAFVGAHRFPGSSRLELRGSIPLGSGPAVHTVSVDNPTLFFVNALRAALVAHGIEVRGPAVDVDDVTAEPSRDTSVPLIAYRSPPLRSIATTLMKISLNFDAETMVKTLGLARGAPTYAAGLADVRSLVEGWGVEASDLIMADGSGLSRYNLITPEALVTILTHVDRDVRLHGPFEASLPIAGRDGTLANRMKGTPAEGNARAKTGSMSNVRGLSGYVTTADGEPVVFSILANNFETVPERINRTADAIVVRLAEFRR